MKNILTIIFFIILTIFFHHCSKSDGDKIFAKYADGQLTRSDLVDRFGGKKVNTILSSGSYLNTIQDLVYKKIIFDHHSDLIDNEYIKNDIQRISNDQKLKRVLDYLVNNHSLNDSIIDFIYSSELSKYTIQDIVVTHRLSYSQHKDRSKKEAHTIANRIRERIETQQITFDEAVSIYVEHPSIKLRNGILGPLRYGKLPKQLNDVIWQSSPGQIIGPVETKFGYHIFRTVKRENIDDPKQQNRKKSIKKEIKGGRYGFLDEYTDLQAEQWFHAFGGEIHVDEIDTLWQIADSLGLFVTPNGISIHSLDKTNYNSPLAKINNQNLPISWFIDQAKKQGTYDKSNFVKAYFLYNTLKDMLHRYSAIMWFDKNKTIFNHKKTHRSIKIKQEDYLFDTFMKQEMEKDSTLTNSVILNRLAIQYDLEINDHLPQLN